MANFGPTLIGVTSTCQPDGGVITGKATTYADASDGGINTLQMALTDSQGHSVASTSGVSPLRFSFTKLPGGVYHLVASDNSSEPTAEGDYLVNCQSTPPAGPGNGCDLTISAITNTPNTVPGATTASYTGNGTITVTATTSKPPLQYSFDGVDWSASQRGQSGVPFQLKPFGATGGSSGYAAATYRVYVKDESNCVVNTTTTISDNLASQPCQLSVEVICDEDAAFIRNLGAGELEYDWPGVGAWSALPYWGGLSPGKQKVHVRDAQNHACTLVYEFTVPAYPRPLKCCFYVLVIAGRWTPVREPLHLDDQELTIKRDEKRLGVSFEYAERPLAFDCEAGRDLIQAQRNLLGDDAEIDFVELQRTLASDRRLEVAYRGRLNLYDYNDQDGVTSVNAQSSNLATLLATRLKTAADLFGLLDLDGGTLTQTTPRQVSTTLHSKTIVKVGHYAADGSYASSGPKTDTNGEREPFVVLGFNAPIVENLEEFYQQQTGFSFIQERYEFHKAKEAGAVTFEFNVNGRATISLAKGYFHEVYCELFFQKNDDTPERLLYIHADGLPSYFDSENYGSGYRVSGTRQLTLAVGDKLYLYGKLFVEDYRNNSEFTFDLLLDKSSFVKVTAETVGAETTAYMFPVYEALDRSLEIITGKPGLLRSNFYGRKDSQPVAYTLDGFGSKFVLGSGFMIRGIAEKPFAPSFGDLLDGLVPIHNVGMAVMPDPATGEDAVFIEAAEDFFLDILAYRLDSCEKFVCKADPTRQPNLVVVGYEKWQPEGRVENALDEPDSVRQFATPTKYNAVTYTQKSKFVAGGYLLESQRRLGTSDTDGPNDNDTFIVAVRSDELTVQIVAWKSYGKYEALVFAYDPKIPFIGGGSKVVVASGPNAGIYTVSYSAPDNSGMSGTPYATALFLTKALPNPSAPLPVALVLGYGYKSERDEAFASVQNLYAPSTAYNLRITPARMLRRHGLFLNAGGRGKQPTDLYRSTYGEGNLKLITRLLTESKDVAESGNVQRQDLADLTQTPFIPEILTFNAFLDQDGFMRLRQCRHGYVAVFDGLTWYTGFILSVKWKRTKNSGTYQLLRRFGSFDPDAVGSLLEFNESEFENSEFN